MKADIIITGKAIFDAVSDEPFEGFVAVKGNEIADVVKGNFDYDSWTDENTEVIECGDKLVMPGMIDAHMHFFDGAFQNSQYMCRDLFGCTSAKECVDTIRKFAAEHPDYDRIAGMGWYMPLWEDLTEPDRYMLDEIEPDRPVYLLCADGHSFWLNSRALEECGISADRKLKVGSVDVDENGVMTGVLHEMEICAPCTFYAQRLPRELKEGLLTDLIEDLNRCGITATTDMAVLLEPSPQANRDEIEIISRLEREGRLNVRLNLYPSLGTTDDFSLAESYREKYHSDKFRVAGLKTFVDGVHGNHTALLIDPYSDMPGENGKSFYPYEVYRDQVTAANRAGFGVKLHTIGEGASRLALDAFAESHRQGLDSDVRNSMEHIETIRMEDLKRLAEFDVTAAIQPSHLMYSAESLQEKVGPERARMEFALKTMLENGVNVAFSTDYPVVPYEPMTNIYFAVTRCDLEGEPVEKEPAENITLAQALRAYTAGSAYCLNMDKKIGTIEKGKLADIVMFDRNLFDIEAKELLDAKIELTVADGKIVYRA